MLFILKLGKFTTKTPFSNKYEEMHAYNTLGFWEGFDIWHKGQAFERRDNWWPMPRKNYDINNSRCLDSETLPSRFLHIWFHQNHYKEIYSGNTATKKFQQEELC